MKISNVTMLHRKPVGTHMQETKQRKQVALRTFLNMMDVPEMRKDTTKPANIRWLRRNLAINNAAHPMFDTTMGLVTWLLGGR